MLLSRNIFHDIHSASGHGRLGDKKKYSIKKNYSLDFINKVFGNFTFFFVPFKLLFFIIIIDLYLFPHFFFVCCFSLVLIPDYPSSPQLARLLKIEIFLIFSSTASLLAFSLSSWDISLVLPMFLLTDMVCFTSQEILLTTFPIMLFSSVHFAAVILSEPSCGSTWFILDRGGVLPG